ncbi:putative amastin [Trypanosoma theileri]|uniref:Putative amastin n=1 Tax=Trypanosoma theileri TaxID=67003 RepID=A0A1X0NYN9_9TRYP|nr:putative amastin [Trypanosoma theileri]ORC89802.1 putative amastin [Trypanosoma theileri]
MLKGINKMFDRKKPTSRTGAQEGNEVPQARNQQQQQQQQQQQYSPRGDDYDDSLSELSENDVHSGDGREQTGESAQPAATTTAAANTNTTTTTPSNRNKTPTRGAGKKEKPKPKWKNPAAPVVNKVNGFFSCINNKLVFCIFFVISFVNWFFTILGTSLSQLDVVGGACYTYWGYKNSCDTVSYSIRPELLSCSKIKTRLQTGAAFSILAILLMSALLFFNLQALMIHRAEGRRRKYIVNAASNGEGVNNQQEASLLKVESPLKWRIVIVTAVALVFELICWCMTTSIYTSRYCEDTQLPRTTAYGVGFGLLLTAWILEIISLVLFALVV